LAKDWNAFAEWSRDLNVKVADVDVINYPGLAGRFWVESVPMIYQRVFLN
jgi:thioredoxin-like negative regulator of GroEL